MSRQFIRYRGHDYAQLLPEGLPDHQTRLLVRAIFPSSLHPALCRPGTPKTQAQDPRGKNCTSPRGAVLPMRLLATSGGGLGGSLELGFLGFRGGRRRKGRSVRKKHTKFACPPSIIGIARRIDSSLLALDPHVLLLRLLRLAFLTQHREQISPDRRGVKLLCLAIIIDIARRIHSSRSFVLYRGGEAQSTARTSNHHPMTPKSCARYCITYPEGKGTRW